MYIYIYIYIYMFVLSLSLSLAGAMPPQGGIGGAAHNRS